jgi:hypothetical protein
VGRYPWEDAPTRCEWLRAFQKRYLVKKKVLGTTAVCIGNGSGILGTEFNAEKI